MTRKRMSLGLCSNFRSIRISKDLSQQTVAARLSISQNAYSKKELVNSQITLFILMRLADLFGYELKDFMDMLTGEVIVGGRKKLFPR